MADIDMDAVTVEIADQIGIVRMSRPEASNAVGPAQMRRLCQCLDEVIDDADVRAIVLSHTGRHFLAGADFAFLESIAGMTAPQVRDDIYQWFQGAAKRLHLTSKPTVAAIGGAAITVGCELAIACDFRIVSERALFQQSWIKLGLIAPLGGAKLLPQIVGWSKAKEMLLQGRAVRSREALEIGLANELVAEDEREARAIALARELASSAPLAYGAAKQGLWQGLSASFDDVWNNGVLNQALLLGTSDHAEAFAAIKDERTPIFRGC